MDLTVNSKNIVALQAHPVQLVPMLGCFELVMPFTATVYGMTDGLYRCLTITGARLSLRDKTGSVLAIGRMEPDCAVVLRQGNNAQRMDFSLKLPLQHQQLERLEVARDGGNLDFVLRFLTRGSTDKSREDWEEYVGEMPAQVPQSAWVVQYNSAKAGNVLLFEVRLPNSSLRHPAEKHLLKAQGLLTGGDWRNCVNECRQFAEELGGARSALALDKLAISRRTMTKDERGDAIVAAIQNYGHAAAHSESKHGELEYNRADAKLMLSLAASLAEFHFNQI